MVKLFHEDMSTTTSRHLLYISLDRHWNQDLWPHSLSVPWVWKKIWPHIFLACRNLASVIFHLTNVLPSDNSSTTFRILTISLPMCWRHFCKWILSHSAAFHLTLFIHFDTLQIFISGKAVVFLLTFVLILSYLFVLNFRERSRRIRKTQSRVVHIFT